MLIAVFLTKLLNGHVGEVDKHIVHLTDVRSIQLVTESAETLIVEVCFDRSVGGDQDVDTEVELLSSYQQRILNVLADNVDLVHVEVLEGRVEVGSREDLFELVDFLEKEYAYVSEGVPCPCDLLFGLTIQVVLGFLWNSSRNIVYSVGNIKVWGIKSRW